jgi:hypothetical protein
MGEIAAQIGRARKGKGGRDGSEPGTIGWVSFDHYTSRPTVAVTSSERQAGLLSDKSGERAIVAAPGVAAFPRSGRSGEIL